MRESTLRAWAVAGLMPDSGLRGVSPEYGPSELVQGAVLALLRSNGLRVADYREAIGSLRRILRAGVNVMPEGSRLLVTQNTTTILPLGSPVPETQGASLLVPDLGGIAESAHLAVYQPQPQPLTEAWDHVR